MIRSLENKRSPKKKRIIVIRLIGKNFLPKNPEK